MIIDTGMLLWSNYDKVIPPLKTLNKMFLEGSFPCAGEWEPFEITDEEYDDLVQYLISLPSPSHIELLKILIKLTGGRVKVGDCSGGLFFLCANGQLS